MRSRGVVVVLALILATIATAGVFLYSRGVKQEALEGGNLHEVVVSKVDISANTELDDLIAQGQFELLQVPGDAVVEGAVTDLSQLRGRTSSAFIMAGEQIPISRVQSGEIPGGALGIPEGHQAMSVALSGPRAIAGALAPGDHVAIYGTFEDVKIALVGKDPLEALRRGVTNPVEGELPGFDTTLLIAPEVEVLRVARESTGSSSDEESQESPTASVIVTLAFTPEEAQKFVYTQELGSVYMALLPPDEPGVALDPLTFIQVFLPEQAS